MAARGNAHGEVAIEEKVCVLRAVLYSRCKSWRPAKGMRQFGMPAEAETGSPEVLDGEESRILQGALRLCKGMAPAKEDIPR